MLLSRNYIHTNQANTNKKNDNDSELEEIEYDLSGKYLLTTTSKFDIVLLSFPL